MDQIKIDELEQKINSQYGNTIGIVIIKDGIVSYEKYFKGCTADSRVHVYSVTKSVISILIGIALDKGCIKNIDEKVLDYFPEYKVKRGERKIQNITLRDMLTMTAPYKYRFFAPYIKYFTTLQVFNKKISYRTFQCIISLRQQLQRKVIPYDKLIIQQRKPDW